MKDMKWCIAEAQKRAVADAHCWSGVNQNTVPEALTLREALDLADLYAAEVEDLLSKAGIPAELGHAERYVLLRILNAGWRELDFRVVKGQAPVDWRARRGRTPAEEAAPLVYRGRNGFVVALEAEPKDAADKTLDNAQSNA